MEQIVKYIATAVVTLFFILDLIACIESPEISNMIPVGIDGLLLAVLLWLIIRKGGDKRKRRIALKEKSVCIGIIIVEAIAMFCSAANSWNSDNKIYVFLFCTLTVIIISIFCLYLYNKGNVKLILTTIAVSLATYLQLPVGFFLFRYTWICWLIFLIMQVVFLHVIREFVPNYKNIVAISSNLLASTIWANVICGFRYYSHISNDLETIGVSNLITIIGTIIVSAGAIGCICDNSKYRNEIGVDYENER